MIILAVRLVARARDDRDDVQRRIATASLKVSGKSTSHSLIDRDFCINRCATLFPDLSNIEAETFKLKIK